MYKLSLLFVSLLCFTLARGDQSSVTVKVNPASNPWWLAVTILNGNSMTKGVELRDSVSEEWKQMSFESDWGYWTHLSSSPDETFQFPISLRLTSAEGSQITLSSVITSLSEHEISTRDQYDHHHNTEAPTEAPTHAPTHAPTAAPTHAPTHAPTSAPTHAPTAAPTHAPTHAPTSAPTHAPTAAPTHAPTSAPTHAPTSAPTHAPTTAPTHAPTTAPSGGCSGGMKMLVPLYTYPGSSWNTVISGASSVATVAIVNPDSGPGGAPDSSYTQYMQSMANAGVEMVGYVHTSYGARSISDVEADIATYASEWPGLVGIFLDEVATSTSELSYYQSLYNYIMSMPGWKYDIINPGALPASGYASVATQIVVIEDVATSVAGFSGSWLTCQNKNQYAAIINTASGTSTMESTVNSLVSKGYFGWVYVTDGGGASAYNNLASYYSTEVSYVASKN